MISTLKTEIVIVGAGAAGLFAALSLHPRAVTVLSEKPLGGISASAFAQGGIAAAVDAGDNPKNHAQDTLTAAAGIADPVVVEALTAEAPAYVRVLERFGVRFERDPDGRFSLSREACHSQRRVLKAPEGDGFGKELMRALAEAVAQCPSITFVDGVSAERLHRDQTGITGVMAQKASGGHVFFAAPCVLLATGGIGGLFAATTNPLGAVGRGIALAARAGARLADLEFVQFHPTALDIGEDPAPLATEALRGEGALLVNDQGLRFMKDRHPMAELAPRDIVARALFDEISRGRKTFLDCRTIRVEKFPALLAACARAGIDPARDLVPVKPAVHYHMGGVATGLDGKTSVPGLWAAGEVAATGLHGANRLASNSLMEAIIMAGRAALDITKGQIRRLENTQPVFSALPDAPESSAEKDAVIRIRRIMTEKVGAIRQGPDLAEALTELGEIESLFSGKNARLADMALVGKMIARAALERQESRGGHFRSDFPATDPAWQHRSFVETTPQTPTSGKKDKAA